MILSLPWIVVSLIAYNVIVFVTGTPFDRVILELPMISGVVWRFELGDALLTLTLILLFVEILKATRTGGNGPHHGEPGDPGGDGAGPALGDAAGHDEGGDENEWSDHVMDGSAPGEAPFPPPPLPGTPPPGGGNRGR